MVKRVKGERQEVKAVQVAAVPFFRQKLQDLIEAEAVVLGSVRQQYREEFP